ncbi:MAG: SusC/RagA family TonB-linked outer membrane protein, partial [Muribaculaceae bacterium]|nr:SusC/RagA family TonB-linked outer membrane protein [Muribaculaceae bacterium]
MKHIHTTASRWQRILCVLTLGLIAMSSFTLAAENITGKVLDPDGEPAIGAIVSVKGQTGNTVTDFDGNFQVNANPGDQITITMLGLLPGDITVEAGKTHYDITLKSDTQALDEVVVIGYGTLEKKRVTSSITSISADDLTVGLGGSTIATALQGKISGMTISGSSSPNASNGYQLRGVSSLKGSSSPLVVIDGIPGGDIRIINQEDIESIDVLKDASAGAIYGTRASAGVILITTKKAKAGKVQVNYSAELAVESVRKRLDLLSTEEYLEYGRGYDYGYDTDWYAEMCRKNPFSHRHVVTLNGGSESLQLYSSLMYQDQEGIVIGDGRKDYSIRLNGVYKMFDDRLQIGIKTQFRQADRDQRNSSTSFEQTLTLNPTTPLMNPDDPTHYNVNEYGIGTNYNPVGDINDQEYNSQDKWFIGDINIKFNITRNLSAQATFGIDQRQNQRTIYYNQFHRRSVNSSKLGEGQHRFTKRNNKSAEAYLSYLNEFGAHRVDAVAGWSFFQEMYEQFGMTNRNFTVDGIGPWDMGAGTDLVEGQASMSSSKDPRERLMSIFGRASYSYKDKYMATVSYRREGSSKFGPNNRWGNFWSVSGGWRISKENFMDRIEWINDLKLRAGYVVTGNNNFSSGYTVRNYTASSDMYPSIAGGWIPA